MDKKSYAILTENKSAIFYVFALNMLLLIPAAFSPIFRRVFADNILTGDATEWLPVLIILMVGVALISSLVIYMRQMCLLRLSEKIESTGTSKYIKSLLNSPLSFFLKKSKQELLSEANALKNASSVLTHGLLGLLANVISVAFYIVMMLRLDMLMTVIVIALALLSFMMTKLKELLVGKLIVKNTVNADALIYENENIASVGIQNIETFKSTSSETFFFQRWLGSKIAIVNAEKESDMEKAGKPLEEFAPIIFLNLLLFISAFRIMDREFSIGMYLAFQAFATAFFVPVNEVLNARSILKEIEAKLEELKAGTKEDSTPEPAEKFLGNTNSAEHIVMKDVSFGYEKDSPVLQSINLEIKPGQRLAILGSSGAGKTTLIKLLQGIYEPCSGEITINGQNPAHMDDNSFAACVGCANQEVTIFSASVRNNITMWDSSVSDAAIYHAASDACIHEYIARLDGAYDYQLTENGSNLSGGEKQRLEIARALLHNPPIIIFDEATGAIDPLNRALIEENLIKRGCTCVIVTHILTRMEDYDEIIILDGGKIAHRGTHEELMRSSSVYMSLLSEENQNG